MTDIETIKIEAGKAIESAKDLNGLNEIERKFLGKKGELVLILRSLGGLPQKEKIRIGSQANELKNFLNVELAKKKAEMKTRTARETENKEWLDITAPGKKPAAGHLHPLTLVRREIENIFQSTGFSVVEGPEIETEYYNFDAPNIPKDHPARDLWDTLWLKNGNLLRTHTTPVQIRHMEKNNPPLRIIAPGRVFRSEATDASHEFDFWQVEGLMVDKRGEISIAHFKGIISAFLEKFFNKKVKTRMKPSYFPFVEPGFEMDIECIICGGKGCPACKNTGWIEVIPGGMVHPNVFKNSGLNPKDWQGFAFGAGMNRLAMLKYKINDIRLFNSGDLRFLNQF